MLELGVTICDRYIVELNENPKFRILLDSRKRS